MTFTDDFERGSLGSDWVDDGPIVFQSDDWVRGGQFLDDGAWQVAENESEGVFNVAMGSIRHAADACDDQFIEAVVGNFFQGHDASVAETQQWVEGDVFLFTQLSPGSDVGIGVHVIIHVNSSGGDEGICDMEFFTTDENGEVTFFGDLGVFAPLATWRSNPDYTIRLEVSAAGHCKAYFEGNLLTEADTTPVGGRYVGIGMEWNRTSYPIGDPPNPGVSFRVESVTGSLCGSTWNIGFVGPAWT